MVTHPSERVDTSQDDLRPELIREANEAIIRARDIVSQLIVRERDYLQCSSPVYRQLVDTIKRWYSR